MIYLVGDVQGCDDALARLLSEVGFSASRDRMVVLGDLVNRGPDSLAVLRRLRRLDDAATCLLGNHDLHLLALAYGVREARRGDTLKPILDADDGQQLIEWLRHRPLACVDSGWLCVHAGVVPQWDTDAALARAAEVEGMLQSDDLGAFLAEMYGNAPDRWIEGLTGTARLRFIINALTRMRFCNAAGVLDLKTKDSAAAAPPGMQAWYAVRGRRTEGQPIAFGHWSTLGLVVRRDLLALDTGCVWGGSLTAVRVDGGRQEVIQVSCKQAQQPGA
jgi:bis(5'-nucleosyl)-tetraphosphatase (symmetrical)